MATDRLPQPAPLGYRAGHGCGGLLGLAARCRAGDEGQPGGLPDDLRVGRSAWYANDGLLRGDGLLRVGGLLRGSLLRGGGGRVLGGCGAGFCGVLLDRRVHFRQPGLQRRRRLRGDHEGAELPGQLLLLRLEFLQLLLARGRW